MSIAALLGARGQCRRSAYSPTRRPPSPNELASEYVGEKLEEFALTRTEVSGGKVFVGKVTPPRTTGTALAHTLPRQRAGS
jgi:hypothetical protein